MSDYMNSGQRAESQYDMASGNYDPVVQNDELLRQQFFVDAHQRYQEQQQQQRLDGVPEWLQSAAAAVVVLVIVIMFAARYLF